MEALIKQNFITASHIIANENPQKCTIEVETFIKDKHEAKTVYSTTPLMIGAGNGSVQMTIITTCLIHWQCTEQDFKDFNNRLKLMV